MPDEMTPDEDEWETAPPGSAAGYDRLMEDYTALRKNRWAAFTDDEMDRISTWYAFVEVVDTADQMLRAEIGNDLERRREGAA